MKKIFLSSFLIFAFAGYSLYSRVGNSPAPITEVTKPPIPQINIQDENIGYEVIPPKPTPAPVISKTPVVIPKPLYVPVSKPTPIVSKPIPTQTGLYRNGNYTGDVADASYGYVQVVATISGGKISDVNFLDYPQDRPESLRKSNRAMPILRSEAITIQDSNVDTVSGASFTSQAYRESLASALVQAKI